MTQLAARYSGPLQPPVEFLLGPTWDFELQDPFPPAKSDAEIAELVSRMGEELGVFDTQTRVRRAAVEELAAFDQPTQPRPRPRSRRVQGFARRRRPPGAVPPPLPVWAWPDTRSDDAAAG